MPGPADETGAAATCTAWMKLLARAWCLALRNAVPARLPNSATPATAIPVSLPSRWLPGRRRRTFRGDAKAVPAKRLARGDIDADEYQRRLAMLREAPSSPNRGYR